MSLSQGFAGVIRTKVQCTALSASSATFAQVVDNVTAQDGKFDVSGSPSGSIDIHLDKNADRLALNEYYYMDFHVAPKA